MVANQRVDDLRGIQHELAQVALGTQRAGVQLRAQGCRERAVGSRK